MLRKTVGGELEGMLGNTKSPRGSTASVCRFGAFELDLRTGELSKRGLKVRLAGQPCEVLRLLVERAGELVSREELHGRLWRNETFVDFEHGLNAAVNKLRGILGDSRERPRYIETLPRRGYRFIAEMSEATDAPSVWPSRKTKKRIRSLAVLPLENLSGDPEQEYFADGMTEALITDLAKISALRVISRTSVMRYKGMRKSLPEIAQELNVDGVVVGSVLRVGNHVRISAQLVDASSDTHLWAESYERDIPDVLALQAEVAQAIAAEIRVKVTPREQKGLLQTRRMDPKAHEAYLLARYYWNKRTPEDLRKSFQYFQKAVSCDPRYAPAYAGMADAYMLLGSMALQVMSPHEAMPKARAAAARALEMDQTLGEAHATLAYVSAAYDYDWEKAAAGFQRAISLNPGYATAHHWYGVVLSRHGELDQGLAELEQAQRLDPLSLQINAEIAWLFYSRREYDRAIQKARSVLELDPHFASAHLYLALAHMQQGKLDEALGHAQKAADSWGRSAPSLGLVGGCYAASGRSAEAKRMVDELDELSRQQYVSAFTFAWIYLNLGEQERVLDYLEQSYAERSSYLMLLKVEPFFDTIRSHPRFQDLQRRVGLA